MSSRANRLSPQPMFEIMSQANHLESLGQDIVHLEIGDTSSEASPGLVHALSSTPIDSVMLGYSPSAGELELRERLILIHNREKKTELGVENVAVLPANASVTQLLALLADPGDSVLLVDPCFPTYRLAAKYLELDVIDVPLLRDREYSLDILAIIAHVESASSLAVVLIDSPSNPSGIAHSPEQLRKLARVCQDNGVALIIDETYRNLVYENGLALDRLPESVIWIYSISKDSGAPGMRIGSVVGPEELVSKVADLSSLTFSCSPKYLQLAAASYLAHPMIDLNEKKNTYRQRIEDFSRKIREETGFLVAPSNSSIYLWIDISRSGIESKVFAHRLLAEANVAVCPGDGFGPSGKDHIRVTVAGSSDRLNEGIARILSFSENIRFLNRG